MRAKLGLVTARDDDPELIGEMLAMMAADRVDYPRWFRNVGAVSSHGEAAPDSLRALVPDGARLEAWVARYGARLRDEGRDDATRREAVRRVNPKYVLRNYLAQQAIDAAQRKDYDEIERLRTLLASPFDEHHGCERYADPPPPWARDLVVSCSS